MLTSGLQSHIQIQMIEHVRLQLVWYGCVVRRVTCTTGFQFILSLFRQSAKQNSIFGLNIIIKYLASVMHTALYVYCKLYRTTLYNQR
jgi:hypothetical protein